MATGDDERRDPKPEAKPGAPASEGRPNEAKQKKDADEPGEPANQNPLPSPTLPKGGGAIRDLGEKFSVNAATGSGSLSVPVSTSAGRGGFHPELALQYDSAQGNGPYGIGWGLSVPRIARKTDRGLPRYLDAQDSDAYVLSGAEDLVPALEQSGTQWVRDQHVATDATQTGYDVLRFRPRVDSLYARIERWTRQSDGDIHWRSITKDNHSSIYGQSLGARIADPADPSRRVFSWLLEETRDGRGNITRFEYKAEDQQNIDTTVGHERTRAVANVYLQRIYYGNQSPDIAGGWLFQVLFDYGELDAADPVNGPQSVWPGRQDPFSDFRPTFEMRTYRLCRRILMLHDFAELGVGWTVVRSTELTYEQNPIATYLRSIGWKGWTRRQDGTYDPPFALPSVDLDYSRPAIEPAIHTVDPQSLANLPEGVDGTRYQLIDLDSEGLPGVFTQQANAFHYARNDGDGQFAPMERVARQPAIANLGGGVQQVADLDGSGEKFLVQLGRNPDGYFTRDGASWDAFVPFKTVPNLDWRSTELKYLDLDGDGLADVLKPEGEWFRWWRSLGRDGYGTETRVSHPRDDDAAPYVAWTDARQSIVIADMTGDGLSDIVRVRNGSIEYWPNRGYGRFGARVVMRGAPRFTRDDEFNPAFIRTADIDGSGTTDLIYLQDGVARVWLNQSGNGYGAEERVPFPSPAGSAVTVADLLGKGTACLVWSSPLLGEQRRQMRYLDLMSGIKPHLLTSIRNNLGATTNISYAPSTQFYLADRRAGRPWVTRLPFPVQVVASMDVNESVTGTRMVTSYRYHHGHYDGLEREFSGFGMVEQDDAETLQAGMAPPIAYTPPKRTKTWFHTGAFLDAAAISTQFAHEYSSDFPQLVPDSVLPGALTPAETREAARALRGRVLRQEIYGLDGSSLEPHPYVVSESNFEARSIQPLLTERHAVFDVVPRETLTAHSERNPGDARNEHEVTLTVDPFGNVVELVHIGYARAGAIGGAQGRTLTTYAQHDYVTITDGADYYRADLLRESRSYELTGLAPPSSGGVYSRAEVAAFVAQINGPPALEIDFSVTTPPATPARRLFERTRHVFLGDQPADEQLVALGLIVDTQRAALTPALVDQVYQALVPNPSARNQLLFDNKYVNDQGLWWAPRGSVLYSAALFYQGQQLTDPFGNARTVGYDAYALLPISATTALGTPYATTATVQNDYRVLAPSLITDANGNHKQAAFDAVGRVTATWWMGKSGELVGDDLAHPSTRYEYHTDVVPAFVYVERREQSYYSDPTNDKVQSAFTYSDGLGREVLTKRQAQPQGGAPRWIGTGRTVFDNKGNPVQKYEPYFSASSAYESVVNGVSDLVHYDPLSRRVRTDHPNGAYSRVELGELTLSGTTSSLTRSAWGQIDYDENDTTSEPGNAWYATFSAGSADQKDAAAKALEHGGTPTRTHVDPLGRVFRIEQDNGFDAGNSPLLFATTSVLDIGGKQRQVTDARGVLTVTNTPDLLGRNLVLASADAGTTTFLPDAMGTDAREWTPNAQLIEREYDPVRRVRRLWVTDAGQRRLAERTFYGETLSDGATYNLIGRVFRQLDGAGLLTHAQYDFKGRALQASRQLATVYDQAVAWPDVADPTSTTAPSGITGLDAESFDAAMSYDALDRVVKWQAPSGTPAGDHVAIPSYNESGQLGTVSVHLAGAAAPTPFVTGIDYNEKLQRTRVAWGNGVVTTYTYEPDTFRLSTVATTRAASGDLQSLAYTYDPVGNVTTIEDGAQQTLFVGNSQVSPRARYTFDAIYRLTDALGREHAGQTGGDQTSTPAGVPIPAATDPQAMRLYEESYQYDAVGNFLKMVHAAANGMGVFQNLWTRTYAPDATSDRLLSTSFGGTTSTPTSYQHDAAGNVTAMSPAPLPTLEWDHGNRLMHAVSSRGDTYCTYDAQGQRVRKVLVPASGPIKERIYLGAYEIYRERTGAAISLERRTLDLMDDQRRIALIELRTVGSDGPAQLIRYQLDNHLGSAVLELDGAANVISYEEYHPHGTSAYRATASVLDTNPKRYAFTAKERDEETGLHYYGARYYASWLGRWLSTDPGGFVGGTNLYCYVRANPIILHDPTGTMGEPALKIPPQVPQVVKEATKTALERAAARWAPQAARVAARTAAAAAPTVATEAAALSAETVAGLGVVGVFTAALVGAHAGNLHLGAQRSGSVVRYGNPFGQPRDDAAFPTAKFSQPLPLNPGQFAPPTLGPAPQPAPATQTGPNDAAARETVNLDTGAIVAATSVANPQVTIALNAWLATKNLVATQSVIREFLLGSGGKDAVIKNAGDVEKALAVALLSRVTVIPDDPSARVMALKTDSNEAKKVFGPVDKIALGTGDKLGIRTATSDLKFVARAAREGVVLRVYLVPPTQYVGR